MLRLCFLLDRKLTSHRKKLATQAPPSIEKIKTKETKRKKKRKKIRPLKLLSTAELCDLSKFEGI